MFNFGLHNSKYHYYSQMICNNIWPRHDELIHRMYGYHIKYTTLDVERQTVARYIKGVLQVYV